MHYKLKTEFMPGIFLTYSLNVFTHTNTVYAQHFIHAGTRGEERTQRLYGTGSWQRSDKYNKKWQTHFYSRCFPRIITSQSHNHAAFVSHLCDRFQIKFHSLCQCLYIRVGINISNSIRSLFPIVALVQLLDRFCFEFSQSDSLSLFFNPYWMERVQIGLESRHKIAIMEHAIATSEVSSICAPTNDRAYLLLFAHSTCPNASSSAKSWLFRTLKRLLL